MKAETNWDSLELEEKLKIAEIAGERHYSVLKKLPNVVSIGFGLREKNEELINEPCIKISVSYKWKGTRRKIGKIPARCIIKLEKSNGQKLSYAVPTDITFVGRGQIKPQSAGGGSKTTTRNGIHLPSGGTGCCFVKFQDYEGYYLLGCAHTFAFVDRYNLPDVNELYFYRTYSEKQQQPYERQIGTLQAIADLRQADAAVVFVDNAQDLSTGYGPNNYSFAGTWQNNNFPWRYSVYGRHGVVPSQWVENTYQINVPLHRRQNRKNYVFRSIPRSRPLSGYAPTQAGDSGAPVVSNNGYLLGMHFAGLGQYSYSFPIQRVLNAFSVRLKLAINV